MHSTGMCTSDVSHVGFRRLQAVRDLRAVARTATQATVRRIIAGATQAVPEDTFHALDRTHGFRLPDEDLSQSLLLAGSLPDDDFDAFRIATAILLADRLQNGAIADTLFWYWDAFQSHYSLLPAWQRAAVMNGFAQANLDGYVDLYDPPTAKLRQSRDETTLRDMIDRSPPAARGVLPRPHELSGPAPELGRTLWKIFTSAHHPLRNDLVLAACLRHVYETDLGFDPTPGQRYCLRCDHPPAIPLADAD